MVSTTSPESLLAPAACNLVCALSSNRGELHSRGYEVFFGEGLQALPIFWVYTAPVTTGGELTVAGYRHSSCGCGLQRSVRSLLPLIPALTSRTFSWWGKTRDC